MKQQYRDNMLKLAGWVENNLVQKAIDMRYYTTTDDIHDLKTCKSVACLIGWCNLVFEQELQEVEKRDSKFHGFSNVCRLLFGDHDSDEYYTCFYDQLPNNKTWLINNLRNYANTGEGIELKLDDYLSVGYTKKNAKEHIIDVAKERDNVNLDF